MNSRFALATWLLWLALPIAAFDYWRAWDRLPARVAVHFDINWRANGWTSREGAFALMMGTLLFMLVTFTITVFVVHRVGQPKFMPWLMLAFFYATVAFVCGVNHWVVQYNLNSRVAAYRTQKSVAQEIPSASLRAGSLLRLKSGCTHDDI